MFACPDGCETFTVSAAPFNFEVFALDDAEKAGVNASAWQPSVANGVGGIASVAPSVEVSVVTVLSGPQLVGFSSNPCRLIVNEIDFWRIGTPPTMVGILGSLAIT